MSPSKISAKIFSFSCIFAISTLLVATEAFSQASSLPQPKIAVKEPVYDFGSVEQGKVVEHDFLVENQGNAPLEIYRVVPSCGCTLADLETKNINSGAKVSIKTTFNTSGFWGNKVKTFRIYSNDPISPSFLLTVQGDVRRDVTVNPPRIFFGDVPKGTSPMKAATITASKDSKVAILEVTSHSNFISVSEQELNDRTRRGKRISVTLKGDLPLGIFRDRLVVKTSSTLNPTITLPILARITGDLIVEPGEVSFGLVAEGAPSPIAKSVRLTNKSANNIRILAVKSDSENFKADVEVIRPGKELEVIVTIQQMTTSIIKGNIIITTDHPDPNQKEVTIPVYGIIKKKGD